MSTATMPTPGGPPRSRGSDENKRRTAVKGRNRSTHGQFENPTLAHPGKSVGQATPRKPLSLIDSNSRAPALKSLKTHKDLEKKKAPVRPTQRSKRSISQAVRDGAVKDEEKEEFPEIETMSRRLEELDELDLGRVFVPPAYFHSVVAALKRPLLPPVWEPTRSAAFPSLPTEPDVPPRPVSPVGCDLPYSREELDLPENLPDLPDIDFW